MLDVAVVAPMHALLLVALAQDLQLLVIHPQSVVIQMMLNQKLSIPAPTSILRTYLIVLVIHVSSRYYMYVVTNSKKIMIT
jgi:hypothetical protein